MIKQKNKISLLYSSDHPLFKNKKDCARYCRVLLSDWCSSGDPIFASDGFHARRDNQLLPSNKRDGIGSILQLPTSTPINRSSNDQNGCDHQMSRDYDKGSEPKNDSIHHVDFVELSGSNEYELNREVIGRSMDSYQYTKKEVVVLCWIWR